MNTMADFLHYITISLAVGINSIGVGIGEGLASYRAIEEINRQPKAHGEIVKLSILGMALIETAAIMGVCIAIILLLDNQDRTMYSGIAKLGIMLAICLPGFFIGIFSALPVQEACKSVARQPFFTQKIMRFMLITQSIIQTPIIFGFLIALLINSKSAVISSHPESLQLLASGLCIGLGSIGPAIGMALFAKQACASLGINRSSYDKLLTFTLISEAIIETPIIFSIVIALLITTYPGALTPIKGIAFISAALCMGLGTIGPGISSGKTAAAACLQIAYDPAKYNLISRISMFAQGLIDTCAIYALLIAIMLIAWG